MSQHSFPNQPSSWIGRSIGDTKRYRLDRQLGSGGMGEVFVATDTRLGKPVALKLLKESLAIAENTDLRERFERECAICAALKNSHIVEVTDYGVTSEGYPFYVMEYLQGQTLGELLTTQPRLPIARTCNIITQVCVGLELAHQGIVFWSESGENERIKVVHRDLKPANLMLIPSALGELVKIIDFGIAKIRSLKNEAATATLFMGTCHYASPEQFNPLEAVDERSDIYSLGVILYEMLTGLDPFGFDFRQQRVSNDVWLSAHLRQSPLPIRIQPNCEQIPAELEEIVLCCLEKSPAKRFASVTQLGAALQTIGTETISSPRLFMPAVQTARQNQQSEAATQIAPESRQRRRLMSWGGGVMLALAAAVSLPTILQSNDISVINTIVSQTQQPEFSLNTHQLSLTKTLSEKLGQPQPIQAAILSPDGNILISAGEDRDPFNPEVFPIKIWNLSHPEAPNTFNQGHAAPVYSLSLSQDGRTLASGSADQTVKIWDMVTGKLLRTLEGHTAPVWSVVLSHDGKTLISGSQDRTINIWDVETGQIRHRLSEHTDTVYSVALSPDQETIVSGSKDFTVKIWSAETGELIRSLTQPEGHRDVVRAVAISPDGTQVASASWEKDVKLWNLQTGKLSRTLLGHTGKVVAVSFINDLTLASGSEDETIRIWNTQNEQVQEVKEPHSDILSLAVGSDQTVVSMGDHTIKLWNWTANAQ
jgi:serine/threonine protein kinase